WQYDFMDDQSGDKYFSLDTTNTIGIYGCNDTTGLNIRSYQDSVEFDDAAQYKWNETAETFQKNGQWVEFTANFKLNLPYQLLLRARNNADANFKLTIKNTKGENIFINDFNLNDDFYNQGGGNEQTDWFLSKIPLTGLWGTYTVRFDWYDNIGEPGIFGGFTFVRSDLDVKAPEWYYISLGTFTPGTNLVVMTTEDAVVYLVPEGTSPDTTSIKEAAVSTTEATAFKQTNVATSGVEPGSYVFYAFDSSNNISEVSQVIQLQYPVNADEILFDSEIKIYYNQSSQILHIKSTREIGHIELYNILGKKVGDESCKGKLFEFQTNGLIPGVYLVRVFDKDGKLTVKKIYKN
ncbi:MAG TPA: T9SS type A sorting domain-containing protein, partial [Prolixibacteraceae bacterium]|nr:T9SS type A sorting domain-containing protein [Prolixibacteraceae bacterium]